MVTQQRLKITQKVYVLRLTASSSLLGKRPAPARSLSNGNRRRRLSDPPSTKTSRESEHVLSQIPRKLHLPQQTCADFEGSMYSVSSRVLSSSSAPFLPLFQPKESKKPFSLAPRPRCKNRSKDDQRTKPSPLPATTH